MHVSELSLRRKIRTDATTHITDFNLARRPAAGEANSTARTQSFRFAWRAVRWPENLRVSYGRPDPSSWSDITSDSPPPNVGCSTRTPILSLAGSSRKAATRSEGFSL